MTEIKVKLKCKKMNLLGKPVIVNVEICNNRRRTLYLLKRNLGLHTVDCDCFEITRNGERIEYDGFLVKYGEISWKDYHRLEPGEKLSISINLTENYKLNQSGHYKIWFNREIFYRTSLKGSLLDYKSYESKKISGKSFLVIGKIDKALLTHGERERKRNQILQASVEEKEVSKYKSPQISVENGNLTEEEAQTFISHTRQAHEIMLSYLQHSCRELQKDESIAANNLHYQMVFGAYDTTRYSTVSSIYNKIDSALKEDVIHYIYDKEEKESVFAYTTKGSRTIYLCQGYRNAKMTGTDSKMGTLFHELTHAIARTDDVKNKDGKTCYGRKRCRQLAKEEPEKAVKNADSYEFFLESIFLNRMTQNKWEGTDDAKKLDGAGVVLSPFQGNQMFLFYAGQENVLKYAVYDMSTNTYGVPQPVTTEKGEVLKSESHPQVIGYHEKQYLFYISADTKSLMLSIGKENVWSEPQPLNMFHVESGYVPNPVLYQDKIHFVYYSQKEDELYWWCGNEDGWENKGKLLNQTYLVHEYKMNPLSFVYQGKWYLVYQTKDKIYYAYYQEGGKTWTLDKQLDSGVDTISGVGQGEEVVHLFYCMKNSAKTRQIEMLKKERSSDELWGTDFEDTENSSVEGLILRQNRFLTMSGGKETNYIAYQREGGDGIFISTQMRH